MSDDDNPHKAEAKPPKSRGGGRSRHPRQLHENSLKNLKRAWQKGQSGNPAGLPRSVIEIARLAREHSAAAIERLRSIMMNNRAPYRDQINAAIALLDRGNGRPPLGIYHSAKDGSSTYAPDTLNGEAPSALLLDASRRRDAAYADELRAELRRIDAMEAQQRATSKAQIDAARAALANGQEVDPVMRMLVAVRGETS